MNKNIANYLIQEGQEVLKAPRRFILFTERNESANIMLNDIENQPHTFFIGCLMNTQIKAERA